MRPTAQWFLLSSVLSVALGMTLRDDGDNQLFPIPAECCDFKKSVPVMGKGDPKTSCVRFVKEGSVKPDEDCVVECTLNENGVLNADKTLNETEFMALFARIVLPDARTAALRTSLNQCLVDYNKSVKIDSCASGGDELFACVVNGITANCPDTMWRKNEPQCKDTVELYKSAAKDALDKV